MKYRFFLSRISVIRTFFWRRRAEKSAILDPYDLEELVYPSQVSDRYTSLNSSLKFNDHIFFLQKMKEFDLASSEVLRIIHNISSSITALLRDELFHIERYSAGPREALDGKDLSLWATNEIRRIESNSNLPQIGKLACTLRDLNVKDMTIWRLLERAIVEDKFADTAMEVVNCMEGFAFFPLVITPGAIMDVPSEIILHSKEEQQLRNARLLTTSCPEIQIRINKIYRKLLPHIEAVLEYQNTQNLFRALKGAFLCHEAYPNLVERLAAKLQTSGGDTLNLSQNFEIYKLLDDIGVLSGELAYQFEHIFVTGTRSSRVLNKLFTKAWAFSPSDIASLSYYITRRSDERSPLAETKSFLLQSIDKNLLKFNTNELILVLKAIEDLASTKEEREGIYQKITHRLEDDPLKLCVVQAAYQSPLMITVSRTKVSSGIED